ncbi:MAG: hypothetical protein KatS3mg035_1025 [Bacteroidia bacterium]|nr:MAG: hypothetical protein KatS3mg035_1025 [Bacteroidia bacterium]
MATKKMTLNELRSLVKQIIKEETSHSEMEKIVSHILSHHFIDYVLDSSFKKDEDGDYGSAIYEFSMLIPKGDEMVNGLTNPMEVERLFEKEYGTKTYSGQAGGSFTKTYYDVKDKGKNLLIHIMYQTGYDV